jgi:hypothetical protein
MTAYLISTRINSPRNDDEGVIEAQQSAANGLL